ncbi:uncharacterized protein LOC141719372 [Apium graveolens]|uniref:uncharacterized protein LOC141719372 n=1 Tax=Apium graveolens TaxID=4045 RepID=UPI003D7ABD5E
MYVVYDGVLYKWDFNQPLLRCVDEKKGNYILREGINLIGKLPKAKGDVKYPVVAFDHFTKWAEVMPLATITAKKIKDFVFNSIECRFGIPYKLISDNEKRLDSQELYKLCKDLKIKKEYEAMVFVEVGPGSLHRDHYAEGDAEVNKRFHLDLLDKARENSQLKHAAYQQRVARYYNKKVEGKHLEVGDLVLRKVMPNTKNPRHRVFGADWEGPYKFKEI